MKNRIYTGRQGLLRGHVFGQAPFAVPETLKLASVARCLPAPEGEFFSATEDGRLWLFSSGIYWWETGSAEDDHFGLVAGTEEPLAVGFNWALLPEELIVGGKAFSVNFPAAMPDFLKINSGGGWLTACGTEDTAPFVPSIEANSGLFFGQWGLMPLPLTYLDAARETQALLRAISSVSYQEAELLRKRLAEIGQFCTEDISSPSGVYAMTYYDCHPGADVPAHPSRGCLWVENGTLYGGGTKSAGKAFLVPTAFAADGTCLGLSLIHAGELQLEADSLILPVVGGIAAVTKKEGESKGVLVPCTSCLTVKRWGDPIDEVPFEGDGYISPLWGHVVDPYLYQEGPDNITLTASRGHDIAPVVLGGQGGTLHDWCQPADAPVVDAVGPLVIARTGEADIATDFRVMRRHIVPGRLLDVSAGAPSRLLSARAEAGKAEVLSSIGGALGELRNRFSHEIEQAHVCLPWIVKAGPPLEIGWWDFPELDIKGGYPRLDGLGDDDGSNDFYQGTMKTPRRGMSVTSDGYIYLTGDSGRLEILTFYFDTETKRWEKKRRSVHPTTSTYMIGSTGLETRVAPYGQGNYQVHHFPGEDWSIFHAPTCNTRYQKLIDSTDLWGWTWGLTGLSGGSALVGALLVQQAFDEYLKTSLGNAMLVYSKPQHVLTIGDPLFAEPHDIVRDDGHFWTFVGWVRLRGGPMAVFSRVKWASGNNPIPEIWGINKNSAQKLTPEESGKLGQAAIGTIPSNYAPRFGLWPGADGDGMDGMELVFDGSECYFPMPESLGDAQAALAETILERAEAWQKKAKDINRPAVTMGQLYDHQVFSAAVIDPSIPIVDVRLNLAPEGTPWISMRHETGVWLSVRCDADITPHLMEIERPWELVSLGVNREGALVALFGHGECSFGIGDYDKALELFGFGHWWERYALWHWYARFLPVVIRETEAISWLRDLWKGE